MTGLVLLPLGLAAASLAAGCDDGLAHELDPGAEKAQEDGALAALAAKVPAGPAMVRNLSNREYLAATSDLIGERLAPDLAKAWTATTQFSGFDAVPWTNLDTKGVRDRSEALETILDLAVASPKVMTCSVSSADALGYGGCAKSVLEPFAARAFGRPLAPGEAASLTARYDETVALAKTVLTEPRAIFEDAVRVMNCGASNTLPSAT